MEVKSKLGVIITLFLGVIVCLAMLPDIASNIQDMTNKRNVANESHPIPIAGWNATGGACCTGQNLTINASYVYTVTNYPSGWRVNSCPLENFIIGNFTENYTVTTDYTTNLSGGTYQLVNTTTTSRGGNNTVVWYDWCDEGYITSSGGRGVARMILIFAAFGLLGYAIYLGAKEYL